MAASQASYGLRMRQLPKPEYRLMVALRDRYGLKDTTELFAVALRLMSEVERYTGSTDASSYGGVPMGTRWIQQVIQSTRTLSDAQREQAS